MSAEAIAKSKLSPIGFERWKKLMRKITQLNDEREQYLLRQIEICKETDRLYTEMAKLWEHE